MPSVPRPVTRNTAWQTMRRSLSGVAAKPVSRMPAVASGEEDVQPDHAVHNYRGHHLRLPLAMRPREHDGLDDIAADHAQGGQLKR